MAICAAVVPFPYRLEASACAAVCAVAAVAAVDVHVALEPVPPPVLHEVLCLPCAVELVGLTPDCETFAFASAPPLACAEALELADADASSFLSWPGAVGVLPASLPAPLPFPLLARAEAAEAPTTTTNTIAVTAAIRFVIPFSPRLPQYSEGRNAEKTDNQAVWIRLVSGIPPLRRAAER